MLNQLPEWIVALLLLCVLFLLIIIIYQIYISILNTAKIKFDVSKITIIDRFGSIIPYLLPLLEGLQNFGQQILPDYPLTSVQIFVK